ncbi:hypothetical protein CTAYLR_007122 [Chrysophaeum taylorii]|uniref:Uncharacterized protein n=1 Tax=Chrysophaeum taylorii TaxID=2483200 RepID=A0AAD7U9A9_9STRA|nr:hypothetical protein CTAYLR_007122 [Chrysophaeum taylorii]
MPSSIRAVMALGGPPWTTESPFLFAVHHDDRYPRGNEHLGPDAALSGRPIGADFANPSGWSMYHGDAGVPGFPKHPASLFFFHCITWSHAASRVRNDQRLAARSDRPHRLSRERRPVRQRGRAVDDCRSGNHARRDVSVAAARCAQSADHVPDLDQPPQKIQDGAAVVQDVMGRADPDAHLGRRDRPAHRGPAPRIGRAALAATGFVCVVPRRCRPRRDARTRRGLDVYAAQARRRHQEPEPQHILLCRRRPLRRRARAQLVLSRQAQSRR